MAVFGAWIRWNWNKTLERVKLHNHPNFGWKRGLSWRKILLPTCALCVLPAHTSTPHPELHRHTLGKKIIIDIEKVYKSPFFPLKRRKCLKTSVSST